MQAVSREFRADGQFLFIFYFFIDKVITLCFNLLQNFKASKRLSVKVPGVIILLYIICKALKHFESSL